MRRFSIVVQNGLGLKAEVTIDIPDDINPSSRTGVAIFKARRVLPDVKPWKVLGIEELAPSPANS